jgi:hypothetical protein
MAFAAAAFRSAALAFLGSQSLACFASKNFVVVLHPTVVDVAASQAAHIIQRDQQP